MYQRLFGKEMKRSTNKIVFGTIIIVSTIVVCFTRRNVWGERRWRTEVYLLYVAARRRPSRYIIAGDDCDRVYLTLQNRSLYTWFTADAARITNCTYGRGETQPRKIYCIINKRTRGQRETKGRFSEWCTCNVESGIFLKSFVKFGNIFFPWRNVEETMPRDA